MPPNRNENRFNIADFALHGLDRKRSETMTRANDLGLTPPVDWMPNRFDDAVLGLVASDPYQSSIEVAALIQEHVRDKVRRVRKRQVEGLVVPKTGIDNYFSVMSGKIPGVSRTDQTIGSAQERHFPEIRFAYELLETLNPHTRKFMLGSHKTDWQTMIARSIVDAPLIGDVEYDFNTAPARTVGLMTLDLTEKFPHILQEELLDWSLDYGNYENMDQWIELIKQNKLTNVPPNLYHELRRSYAKTVSELWLRRSQEHVGNDHVFASTQLDHVQETLWHYVLGSFSEGTSARTHLQGAGMANIYTSKISDFPQPSLGSFCVYTATGTLPDFYDKIDSFYGAMDP